VGLILLLNTVGYISYYLDWIVLFVWMVSDTSTHTHTHTHTHTQQRPRDTPSGLPFALPLISVCYNAMQGLAMYFAADLTVAVWKKEQVSLEHTRDTDTPRHGLTRGRVLREGGGELPSHTVYAHCTSFLALQQEALKEEAKTE